MIVKPVDYFGSFAKTFFFNSLGILIAKKKLFRNRVPYNGGGGSVFFVRMILIVFLTLALNLWLKFCRPFSCLFLMSQRNYLERTVFYYSA